MCFRLNPVKFHIIVQNLIKIDYINNNLLIVLAILNNMNTICIIFITILILWVKLDHNYNISISYCQKLTLQNGIKK